MKKANIVNWELISGLGHFILTPISIVRPGYRTVVLYYSTFFSLSFLVHVCFIHSGIWPSYLMDLLSRRLVGSVGAKHYMRSSYSDWALSMTRDSAPDLLIMSQMP